MRQLYCSISIVLFFFSTPLLGQLVTFSGQGNLRVPPSGTVGVTTSPASVSGVGVLGGCVTIENVTMNMEHTWDGDIGILLIGPTGAVLELSTGNGGAGDDYLGTVFSDGAGLFITDGSPPFTGDFRPEGRQTNLTNPYSNANPVGTRTFANTYNGTNANGTWQLYINDYVAADIGTLIDWSITFNIGGNLTADAGPDQTICPGQSATLTANGIPSATNYQWSSPPGGNSQSITVSPVTTTTYTVTVSNGSCNSTDQVTVFVSGGNINVNAGADRTICEGQSTILTATGSPGLNYEWSDGQVGSPITVAPSATTPYTVTATNSAGCTATDQVLVTVTPAPTANAGPDLNICSGQSRVLTASGGGAPNTYSWSTGQNGASITVSPNATTTYTVTVSFGAGCSSTDEVEVVVDAAPTANAGLDQTICNGGSATLNATGGPGSFQWSTGETDPTIVVSPTTTTTYTITVTSPSGFCTATDNVRVTVSPAPNANAGPDKTVCEGGNTTLTATGGTNYIWSTGQPGATISVAPPTTTTYGVTVTNAGGCTAEDEVTVNIVPNPTADAGPDISICRGDNTALTASGGNSYLWNTGQSGATIVVAPTTTTLYTVRASVGTCQGTDEVLVTVLPKPTVSLGNNRTICEGQSVNLTATGTSNVVYEWDTGESTQTIAVSPAFTTVYSVTVTNFDGCTASADVTVTVNTLAANVTPDVQICAGQNTTLSASGGGTYRWNTGQNTANLTVTPTTTTTYTVTVTQGVCSTALNTTVEVQPTPVANAGPDQTRCAGETVNLSANGGADYQWNTGETDPNISVNPTATTTYTVTVSNGICNSIDRVIVNVTPAPTVTAGPSGTLCEGQSATLSATVTGSGSNTLRWSTGANTNTIVVTPSSSTVYQVTATNAFGCTGEADVALLVNPIPVANAGADVSPCAGTATTLSATGGGTYRWSSGETTANISVSPNAPTTYTVTVTVDGCSSTDAVVVNTRPAPVVTLTPNTTLCAGAAQTLTVGGGTTYAWSTNSSNNSISVTPTATTTYTVTVSAANGCTSTAQSTVTVTPLPVAAITGDLTLCTGQAGALIAAGGGTYQWDNGETQATLNIAPTSAATYTVTVTANGCSRTATANVAVLPAPTADAGLDQSICAGQDAVLSANGGVAFAWNTGQNVGSFKVTPTATTTYTVTISNGNCSDTDEITVEVRPAPSVTLTPDATICIGETATLTAVGTGSGLQYTWSAGGTGRVLSVTPAATTSYTVSVTNNANCTATATANIAVTPLPIPNAGIDAAICVGENVTLTATGGGTYRWSTGDTAAAIVLTPNANTTYTVTVTANGCSANDTVSVVVNALPNPTLSRDTTVCEGQSVALNAGGGSTYRWSDGTTAATLMATPTANATFTVTVSNAESCTASAQVSVAVVPLPKPDAGPDQTICIGASADLAAIGGGTYLWNTGAPTAALTVSPNATTTYTVTVTANGCSAVDALTVNVNPLPVANAGPNAAIATGQSSTLTATGGGTYVWSTGQTDATITVRPDVTTTYTVTVTLNGCTATDEVTVFVNEPPTVDLGPDRVICVGESVALISAASVPFGTAFRWSSGETTSSIIVSPGTTTDYTVELTSNNLSTRDTIRVVVNQRPIGVPSIQGPAVVCAGASATYNIAIVNGATAYRWVVPPGAQIVSGQGTTQIEVDWQQNSPGPIEVVALNACGESPATLLPIAINQPPTVLGPIAGEIAPCASRTLTYNISGQGLIDKYEWSVAGGTIAAGQGTNAANIQWDNGPGGRICVLATNVCGESNTECLDVATVPPPIAEAGLPVVVCGTAAALAGSGVGAWQLLSGPGTATLTNADDPQSAVNVSTVGTYTFTRSASQGGCTDVDTVSATFNPFPQWAGATPNCNNTNTAFSVALQISGGTPPYRVNGAPIVGNTFVSTEFDSGNTYQFTLTDGAGCAAPILVDSFVCNCTSAVGNMDLTPIRACVGDTLRGKYLGGENLDGDDIVVFVLHTGQLPSGILATNTEPVFAYQTAWAPGGAYFISALVGSKSSNDLPNLADRCLAFSPGTPVQINPRPSALLGGSGSLCAGQCAELSFDFVGTGPFSLVYTEGNIQRQINSATANFRQTVCPNTTTAYQLVQVNDALCPAPADGTAQLVVETPPSARIRPSDLVCNSGVSGFSTVRDFSTYVVAGDKNGVWRELGQSGAAGTLPALDFSGVKPGQYAFQYTTASAVSPCTDSSYVIQITVSEFCLCPPLDIQAPPALCNAGNTALSLNTLVGAGTPPGVWALASAPTGAPANLLSGNAFNPQNAPAGTYQLAYTLLTPPPGTCPDRDTLALTIDAAVRAGQPKPALALCADQPALVNLPDRLDQATPGGTWKSLDNLPLGIFDPSRAQFDPKGQNPGLYQFRYTVPGNGACGPDSAVVAVRIQPLPTANAGPDATLTCTAPSASLGTSSGNPDWRYQWSNGAGTAQTTATQPGLYVLTVQSQSTGCLRRDTVAVGRDADLPTALISANITQLTCAQNTLALQGESALATAILTWRKDGNTVGTGASLTAQTPGCYLLLAVNPTNGCEDTARICITENKVVPVLNPVPGNALTCLQRTTTLNAGGNSNNLDYSWQSITGGIVGNANTDLITVNAPGIYTVLATDRANGCTSQRTATVLADTLAPIANANAIGALGCSSASASISAGGSSQGSNIAYAWSLPNGSPIPGNPAAPSATVNAEGVYLLTVRNLQNGCVDTDTAWVRRNAGAPTPVNALLSPPACAGDCNGVLQVPALPAGVLLSLNNGAFGTQTRFEKLCGGRFEIRTQDAFGCEWDTTVNLIAPLPFVLELGPDLRLGLGDSLRLEALVSQPLRSLQWTGPVDTTDCTPPCTRPWLKPLGNASVSVRAVSLNGCVAEDALLVRVEKPSDIFIPNSFTPESSNKNSVFMVSAGPSVDKIESISVFNRWGELVFQRLGPQPNDPQDGWDGRQRGEPLSPGVFVYMIKVLYLDGRTEVFSGDVTLVR